MECLITGVAGFIGSHLAEALLGRSHTVRGVDCFTDYYPRARKERNLAQLRGCPAFQLHEIDLVSAELGPLVEGVDWVFHLAAQAGVRSSWSENFRIYTENNVLATQRLLEAVKGRPLRKFIYASSSSIYGDSPELPLGETTAPHPVSPYGVTKLAGEYLCYLYGQSYGVPVVSLRYFSVYGPRQRPDMAIYRFIQGILSGEEVPLYGDGTQSRDFTYVDDVVQATLRAAEAGPPGRVFNIGGGSQITLLQTIALLEELAGRKLSLRRLARQAGDVFHTLADVSRARAELHYAPATEVSRGLREQWLWQQELYREAAS